MIIKTVLSMIFFVKLSDSCITCFLFISDQKYQKQYIFAFLHIYKFCTMHSQLQICTTAYLSLFTSLFFFHFSYNFLLLWNESYCFTIPKTQKWSVKHPWQLSHSLSSTATEKMNSKSIAIYNSIHRVAEVEKLWQAKQKRLTQ